MSGYRTYLAAVAAGVALFAAVPAAAQVSYTFQGANYVNVQTPAPGACTVGDCPVYTTAMAPSLTLTFAAPLPASMPMTNVVAQVIAFSYDDGARVVTGPDANAIAVHALIRTDVTGRPDLFNLLVQRTPGPPYLEGQLAQPNGRYSHMSVVTNGISVGADQGCPTRTPSPGDQTCTGQTVDAQVSLASNLLPVTVVMPAPPPATVPTLSEWAMILFALLLAGGSVAMLNRRAARA